MSHHPRVRTIHLVGSANAGKSWLRSVVFHRRIPLELVLEKRETKLAVTNVRNTDFVHLDIWGKSIAIMAARRIITRLN